MRPLPRTPLANAAVLTGTEVGAFRPQGSSAYLDSGGRDLDGSVHDGLGLPTEGIIGRECEHGAVAFFQLSGGLRLAIWAQADLAHDSGLPMRPASSTSFSVGHNVRRREEVDAVMDSAKRAGAELVKRAGDTFYGGYAGYFRDPDGHLWEIVWNPQMMPAEQ